ncbi:SPFH domain-containing protein [Dietzia psychralcaliphila]|uniref:Stomatin family protein n=1 Tax=Dietzia psychralcaliphila TaxID=139021 RepID=A0AAD0JWG6_9ACTN|nr:SPFH domain-containing protein [Dietzia psychralcaliphila]AWH96721.1 stomatin family protein [Dietzia psychralcaliphila]PTM89352.1 regulator of protease activity HflC (stomatin/prohibitin superfamily) [Dietzia psychralcaliphila]
MSGLIFLAVIVVLIASVVVSSVKLIPQAEAAVIERLGRYQRTVSGQLTLIIPFIDRVRAKVDLRERVVTFPPQSMITEDNLTLSIDTVVFFQVTDPKSAVYEINNYIVAVEQLATTTLRNVVGGLTLEQTLTSRDMINKQLRGVLDSETGRWGLRVARVELRSIDPPLSIQESMEKQMKADREKRATILTAEGQREAAITTAQGAKQASILSAEGNKQASILNAEADRQSRMLRAQGERAARYLVAEGQAAAIARVNAAVKASKPTPEMLAYQYVQNLPEMAKGEAATMWMIPSQFGDSLENFVKSVAKKDDDGVFRYEPAATDGDAELPSAPEDWFDTTTDPEIARSVAAAEAAAEGGSSATATEKPKPKPKPGVFDMVPTSEGGVAPDDTAAIAGPQGAQPGQPAGVDPGADLNQGQHQGGYPVDEAGRNRPQN